MLEIYLNSFSRKILKKVVTSNTAPIKAFYKIFFYFNLQTRAVSIHSDFASAKLQVLLIVQKDTKPVILKEHRIYKSRVTHESGINGNIMSNMVLYHT